MLEYSIGSAFSGISFRVWVVSGEDVFDHTGSHPRDGERYGPSNSSTVSFRIYSGGEEVSALNTFFGFMGFAEPQRSAVAFTSFRNRTPTEAMFTFRVRLSTRRSLVACPRAAPRT